MRRVESDYPMTIELNATGLIASPGRMVDKAPCRSSKEVGLLPLLSTAREPVLLCAHVHDVRVGILIKDF